MGGNIARTVIIFGVIISSINGVRETNVRLTAAESPPFGPFYCQARCLASCIEMNLASTLEACSKFCPPFDAAMPCPPNNFECWRTCGIPQSRRDKPPPPTINFVMAQHVSSADQRVEDPFTIELTWDPVPSASLYIVEMYPLNRQPRPGENNFFRALTTFPTYMVRKEDECTVYDIRVLPVNAFGVGAPQYTRIEAPRPVMTGPENFFVRQIRRDPMNDNFVVATIDYAILAPWPVQDVELVGVRVKAIECRGMSLQTNGTSNLGMQTGNAWYPFYDIMVEKTPTPNIQLAFLNEVVKADCLFQMRVSALTTRCNTTMYFDSNGGALQDSTVGVDFRINCFTAEGVRCDDNSHQPPFVAPPNKNAAIRPTDNLPILPPLITGGKSVLPPSIPTGASTWQQLSQPRPTDMQIPSINPGSDGLAISPGSINENTHPLLIDYLAINSQPIPANCDMEPLDVQPVPSVLGPSLIDLTVSWSEKNPGTQRRPSYYIVRYGPIVRTLVEVSRRPQQLLPGQETIVRAGAPSGSQFTQGPPERQIKVTGIPTGSLLSFQVCAVYDPTIERLISWDVIRSQHVDLLALQPYSGPNDVPNGAVTSLSPLATDESPLSAGASDNSLLPDDNSRAPIQILNPDTDVGLSPANTGANTDETIPVFFQVGIIDSRSSGSTFWLMLIGGLLLVLLTGVMAFVFVLRLCLKRAISEKELTINQYPEAPIAMITKAHQIQSQKEKEAEAMKESEKIALP